MDTHLQTILWILFWFQIKHFVADFPLQSWAYQYVGKGKYGHLGGILHSGIQATGTLLIALAYGMPWWIALIDFVVHYHIDWAKVNINNRFKWGPTTHSEFWVLLGFDQLLHQATYLALILVSF